MNYKLLALVARRVEDHPDGIVGGCACWPLGQTADVLPDQVQKCLRHHIEIGLLNLEYNRTWYIPMLPGGGEHLGAQQMFGAFV